ncbi:MAG TPA: sugar ABC transporter permease [Treponema sp.]|nr:sugar ABC transporter permease [Treponema sp.]
MLVPAALLFGMFFAYPLLRGIGLSLTDWDGIGTARFVGLDNFLEFFGDRRALRDVSNTVLFALGSAPGLVLAGLALALLIDRPSRFFRAARTVIYLPAIASPLVMGYVWYFLLQPGRGLIARAGRSAFGPSFAFDWLSGDSSALVLLVAVNVWQYAGMTMVIFLAGLQAVPQEMYEAARLDGAGAWTCFRKITLPFLIPSMKVNVVTNIIGSLSVFDVVMGLTEGGPGYATETLSIYIMRKCFGSFTGYSTAVAVVLFLIILVPTAVYLRAVRSSEFER